MDGRRSWDRLQSLLLQLGSKIAAVSPWDLFPWFDNNNARSLSRSFRIRRFIFFQRVSGLQPGMSVLDVAGQPSGSFFANRADLPVSYINLYSAAMVKKDLLPEHQYIQGDARCIPIRAQSFDIVFSNSLLEHLDVSGQQAVAQEIQRVGRFYFIQVPYRYFPWEPHYNFLCVQFLPQRCQRWLWYHWPLSYGRRYGSSFERISLPTRGVIRDLFPAGTITAESFGPFTKALYAWGSGRLPRRD